MSQSAAKTIRRYMAIRYTAKYNKDIHRIVENYNKKRNRLKDRGYKNIPEKIFVSELKARFNNRNDLNKELRRIKNFTRQDVINKIQIDNDIKIPSWQLKYVKTNRKSAIEYFEKEYQRVSKRVARFPGEKQFLVNTRRKLELLNLDPSQMTGSQFRSSVATISEFFSSPRLRNQQYRGFLSEVDWVMEKLNYSEETRKSFFKKFSQLYF